MNARIRATCLVDLRLQARNGFYWAATAVAVLTIVVLRLLPTTHLAWLLPVMIVNNLMVNGFYFMAGLVLLEKAEASLEAQIVSPLRSSEYLTAKVGTLALLSLVENGLITLTVMGLNVQLLPLSAGIALGAAIFALAGFAAVARYDAINTFIFPSLVYLLLLAAPLLTYFGFARSPLLDALLLLHPLQPVLALLQGAVMPTPPAQLVYGLVMGVVWVGIFAWWANRAFRRFVVEQMPIPDARLGKPGRDLRLDINGRLARRLGALRALGPIDVHSVARDAMLRWMLVVPFVVALAIRWVLPPLLAQAATWTGIDMAVYFAPLMGYTVLLIVPYFWGAVIGFLLLDQRDEQTLTALQVTPLPLRAYLTYRLLTPALLAALMTLLVMPITGLFALAWWAYPLLALSAAPMAPLAALALAALAQNKVQGLALMKAAGIVLTPPLIAYFLPTLWQLPFMVAPTWWLAQTLWRLQVAAPGWWWTLAGGLTYQALLLVWLVRRFDAALHR